jgi:hypothetical protein
MLLHAVQALDEVLNAVWDQTEAPVRADRGLRGLQVIFFDGEEAMVQWSAADSLYGARHLASKWELSAYAPRAQRRNRLGDIDLLVLLDLLGTPGSTIPSYFRETHWAYAKLAALEKRLDSLGLLRSAHEKEWLGRSAEGALGGVSIGDDHVPFFYRGVPTLHVIPHPFPSVWHTINDDKEHLSVSMALDFAVIISAFVAEWFDLGDALGSS